MEKYDLIVAGGGFAGCAAAIRAAEEGLRVLLVEQSNCLGGAPANCLVNPFMPYSTQVGDRELVLSKGLFQEITDALKSFSRQYDTAIEGDTFNEEYLKIILARMVQEAGVELLYRSYITGVEMDGNRVVSITAANKSGNMRLEADYFIDATGDADLTAMAGFPFRLGRAEDSLCQPMTLCFRVSNVDMEGFHQIRSQITPLYQEWKRQGKITNPREDVLIFNTVIEGVLHFNTTRVVKLNPTDALDLTKAEIIAREQVLELFLFLKENFDCFKNSHLLSTAAQIGVRESRMIDGEYILTGKDLVACRCFDDAIALGNYDIDIHNPEGEGTSHYYFGAGEYYTIPYRTLVPKGSINLLTAGRCISVDHEAQASIRIMPIVSCLGEAAGLAIAQAKKAGIGVREINTDLLKEKLLQNGAELGLTT